MTDDFIGQTLGQYRIEAPSLLKNSLLSFSREHELNWPKRFSLQMNKGTAIEKS